MKQSISFLLICLVSLCLSGCHGKRYHEEEFVRYEYGLPIDSFRIDTGYVKSGETLGAILNRKGATRKQLAQITTLPRSEFDVRTIRAGKEYLSLYQTDTAGVEHLCYWIYIYSIREATVLHLTDSVHAEHKVKPVRYEATSAQVVIESSLWNAMVGNGLPIDLALELSDIYAWTIDFFGLQKGDSIRVYYDQMYVDTTCIGIGKIYAANFYHARKWQEAYWFDSSDTTYTANTSTERPLRGYFDADGNSLRKAFLKAPLNYKRISSKFTYARKHPIYKTVRPHTGVDYAAPMGTPVVSIGDGTVIWKGYKGGGGHTIKIKHNSNYQTAYLHLSKYAQGIALGKHVSQGQVIGYVGSTGSSTGPHLDFRVWKNGQPIDPLKMVSPPVEPIPAKYKDDFARTVETMKVKL